MLLTIKAMVSKMTTPLNTGVSTYRKPRAWIFADPIVAISAVAPPGGCIVLVICIITIDKETDSAADSHNSCGMSL